ncbi:DUF302 domain-containing protein [Nocardioides sp. GY 10127]|uniref:DUF302 domain-containing protein n=1 Tax=Nocardioides sp. GY 10127 TaxID=2569762 RepID=UPI0010A83EE2|nr:DUF302 domain-containing protein [Nocardioides sp. GY 10127]TIC84149.1 DUF302 domain-containing protein [Nocardioides sp. GY 10127]
MASFTLTRTLDRPWAETVEAARAALAEQGFGVLTEIDLQATLKAKIDVDIEPQIILGACRPPLAYAAITAEPSIAAVLPCNVVVRATDAGTVVEVFDPLAMVGLAGVDSDAPLCGVADDARTRLEAALAAL